MGRIDKKTVVLDTNLFVAAFWNAHSNSAKIIRACEENRLILCFSSEIIAELNRILPRAKTSIEYRQRIDSLIQHSKIVVPEVRFSLSVDPEDDKFLECAVTAGAEYLITNDMHLLEIHELMGTQIVTPRTWMTRELN